MTRSNYRPDPGPPCRVCGYFAVNVVHDDETVRAHALETWAFATPEMGGKNYYEWAGIEYHPFEAIRRGESPGYLPPRPKPVLLTDTERRALPEYRDAYNRGYQAGYGARRKYGASETPADREAR